MEELQCLDQDEQADQLLAMSTKQLRKLKKEIKLHKKRQRQAKAQAASTTPQAHTAASDRGGHMPMGEPAAARRRVGDPWSYPAFQTSGPPSPRPYPYRDVEALMWVAGDVHACGTAGVGTVDWMVADLHQWGSALVAEIVKRQSMVVATPTAPADAVVIRLRDVKSLLPVACAHFEALSTETKKARTAQNLENRDTEVANMPPTELHSVVAGQPQPMAQAKLPQTASPNLRSELTTASQAAMSPCAAAASVSVPASTNAVATQRASVGMGVESSEDFIAFADERTKQMSSASELFTFTKARETSLVRRNRPARGKAATSTKAAKVEGSKIAVSYGNQFLDWLLGHYQADDESAAKQPQPPEAVWTSQQDDEDEDYDNLDNDTDGGTLVGTTAVPVSGADTGQVAVEGAGSIATIDNDARAVIASMLRSRLFGIVSSANRSRNIKHVSACVGRQHFGQNYGELKELSCALTIAELVEARLRLPMILPFLSWSV